MLVVTDGKVVIGFRVYTAGDAIDGLSPEVEENLVSAGLAKRADFGGTGADVADDAAEGAPLSYDKLKERCRELGLSPRGKKAELEARIAEAEAAQGEEDETEELDDDEIEDDELDDEEPPALSAEVPR